jgi:hypothetical protein
MTLEQIDRPLALFLVIAVPLAWGLGMEYVFELLRRRRSASGEGGESEVDG